MNWINLYFEICVYVWALDVIAVLAILLVKPLRKWCWKQYGKLIDEFTEVFLSKSEMENEDENL